MHALRIVPALVIFFLVQLGMHRLLSSIFFARPEQARARRRLAWALSAVALFLPLQIGLMRAGVELPVALRWPIFEPVLAWLVLSLPLLGLLALARALVRRWPGRASRTEPPDAPPIVLPAAPEAVQRDPEMPAIRREAQRLAAPAQALPAPSLRGAPLIDRSARGAPDAPDALSEPRRVFLVRTAQALLGGAVLFAGRGIVEAEQLPEISRTEISLRGLHPDLDGLTILQLSDIHAGALITEARMKTFADAAAALGADLIVFTGDLLDGSGRAAGPYSRAFQGLHGKLGTFAILGNHDYYAGERSAQRAIGDAGQTLLRNAGLRISRGQGTLWLGGVDDLMARDRGGSVDPVKALRGASPGEPRVLLAHRPSFFDLCADAGADLVLSGHTHGGQLALSPALTPARLLGPYTMGHYQPGPAQLYVHRGMGVVSAAPVRLGAPPELALLTLRRV